MTQLHFLKNGDVALDNAQIMTGTYRNFSGAPDTYNAEGGKRYFNVRIDDPEIVQELASRFPNLKIKEKVYEGEDPFWFFKIIINYRYDDDFFIKMNPSVKVRKDGNPFWVEHDETEIGEIDYQYIISSDIQFHVSYLKRNDTHAAYLRHAYITVENGDYFASKYAEEEHPEE